MSESEHGRAPGYKLASAWVPGARFRWGRGGSAVRSFTRLFSATCWARQLYEWLCPPAPAKTPPVARPGLLRSSAASCGTPWHGPQSCAEGTPQSRKVSLPRPRPRVIHSPLIALILLSLVGTTFAQSSGSNYTLRKQAVVPGGRSSTDVWALSQSLAEPGAGTQTGGNFRLTGGLQTPRFARPNDLFANGFE